MNEDDDDDEVELTMETVSSVPVHDEQHAQVIHNGALFFLSPFLQCPLQKWCNRLMPASSQYT